MSRLLFNYHMWEPRGTRVPTHVNIYLFLKNVLQINKNWTKFAGNVRKTHMQIAFFQNTNWNPSIKNDKHWKNCWLSLPHAFTKCLMKNSCELILWNQITKSRFIDQSESSLILINQSQFTMLVYSDGLKSFFHKMFFQDFK